MPSLWFSVSQGPSVWAVMLGWNYKGFQKRKADILMMSNHCDSWLLLQPFIFLFPQTPPSLLLTCPFTGHCGKFAFLLGTSCLCISLPAPAASSSMHISCQLPVIFLQAIVFGGGVLTGFIIAVVLEKQRVLKGEVLESGMRIPPAISVVF